METFNEQIAAVQSQLNKLQRPYTTPFQPAPVHKIIPVDGLPGAEAILKEMPAGSSDRGF